MENVKFTVLGSTGFIGSNLVRHLRDKGADVSVPSRNDIASGHMESSNLGHVVYAIGLTADFRTRLSDTVEAHVGLLDRLLNGTQWQSWLFLSSTRVYGALDTGTARTEDEPICIRPNADSVYDLSKLLGEALVLSRPEPQCRVARLSNVFGVGMPSSTFLPSIVHQARSGKSVTISEDPLSAKDYVPVDSVVELLREIALIGRCRSYNVASGVLLEHQAIANILERKFAARVIFKDGGTKRRLPLIDVARIRAEFGQRPICAEREIEKTITAMWAQKG